jgi:hypothetical protein
MVDHPRAEGGASSTQLGIAGIRRDRKTVCYACTMDMDTASLVASLIVSSVGFVVFGYGKRQQRVPQIVVGLVLMAFPYFVPSVPVMAGIAAALLGGLWLAIRFGL